MRARVAPPNVVMVDGNVPAARRLAARRGGGRRPGSRRRRREATPAWTGSGPPRTGGAPDRRGARQGRLILIAEDDAINQKVILRQIELLGYAAEMASNGAEALRLWRTGHYALLLTDLHMPEMDGYALAEAIRREETQRGAARQGACRSWR